MHYVFWHFHSAYNYRKLSWEDKYENEILATDFLVLLHFVDIRLQAYISVI